MEAKKKQCIPVSLKNVSIHLICVDNLDSVGFFSKIEKVGTRYEKNYCALEI